MAKGSYRSNPNSRISSYFSVDREEKRNLDSALVKIYIAACAKMNCETSTDS